MLLSKDRKLLISSLALIGCLLLGSNIELYLLGKPWRCVCIKSVSVHIVIVFCHLFLAPFLHLVGVELLLWVLRLTDLVFRKLMTDVRIRLILHFIIYLSSRCSLAWSSKADKDLSGSIGHTFLEHLSDFIFVDRLALVVKLKLVFGSPHAEYFESVDLGDKLGGALG